jgi:hypothetical protein
MDRQKSHEYRNDFLYFVIGPDERRSKGVSVYCSGVNITRFLPITKGRHRLGLNPVVKGLQLVNLGVRALALSQGATPKAARGNDCAGIASPNDLWYSELLLIENAPEPFPDDMISYCVINLLRKIFKAIMLDPQLPDTLLKPDELQVVIEDLCRQYGGAKKH